MDKIIDFEKIYKNIYTNDTPIWTLVEMAGKQSIRQALPLILEHVAENAKANASYNSYDQSISRLKSWVNKESITSQKDEIIKMLGL